MGDDYKRQIELKSLSEEVARALGWRSDPEKPLMSDGKWFKVYAPDGTEHGVKSPMRMPIYDAIEDGIIPNYAADLNAAWTLFKYPVYTQMYGADIVDFLSLPPQEASEKLCREFLRCLEDLKHNDDESEDSR